MKVQFVSNLVNSAGRVVVWPTDMHGWVFYNDQTGAACTDTNVCHMIAGPDTVPSGTGSMELADSLSTDGKALVLADYASTRFDQITTLSYSTYRRSLDAGNNLAISLQFNADYDLTDGGVGYQGRIVFEPYQGAGGTVPRYTWQNWNAKAGKWWGTKTTVTRHDSTVTNTCIQATPCTWTQLLTKFPNIGVHGTYGAVVLKAGSGWPGFRGSADKLTIAIAGVATTYDFELNGPAAVPAEPQEGLPYAYYADTIHGGRLDATIMREVVLLRFNANTSTSARQSAIDGVNGLVVGGWPLHFNNDGFYLVRVPSNASGSQMLAAIEQLRTMPQVASAKANVLVPNGVTYRRPYDGPGERRTDWRSNPDSAFGNGARKTWALEAVNAPFGWGCATGGTTRIGVVDMGLHVVSDFSANVDTTFGLYSSHTTLGGSKFTHGTQVASILAARGNDSVGTTGMMWTARLALAEVAFDSLGKPVQNIDLGKLERDVIAMIVRGARAINFSVGYGTAPNTVPGADTIAASRAYFADAGREIRAVALGQSNNRALWVISSGNLGNSTNVTLNYFTALIDTFSEEGIIVTGAGVQSGTLAPDATGVGAIDVAAPGELVSTATVDGDSTLSGVSAATPLVTGAAGLLFAFDSTLTPSVVKSFILQAADGSGRTAGSFRFLDVYGALRLAAGRNGAPLCGNRVWIDSSGAVVAERDPVSHSTQPLFTPSGNSGTGDGLLVYHGGARIDFGSSRRFDYSAATRTWQEHIPYTPPGPDEVPGGTYKSSRGPTDHDDSVRVSGTLTGEGASTAISLRAEGAVSGTEIRTMSYPFPITVVNDSACTRQVAAFDTTGTFIGYQGCAGYGWYGTLTLLAGPDRPAIAPKGHVAFVPVTPVTIGIVYGSYAVCPGEDPGIPHPDMCKPVESTPTTSLGYTVLKADLDAGTWSTIPLTSAGATTRSDFYLQRISISERGDEAVLQIAKIAPNGAGASCSQASTTFMALAGSSVTPGTTMLSVPLDGTALCAGAFDGAATISPLRRQAQKPRIKP